jgi:hypothetical protein
LATIIYPDGREQEVQPRNGSDFHLDELKPIVGTGAPAGEDYIEIVQMRDGRIMVINENGKLLDLPRNEKATQLAGLPTPAERAEAIAEYKRLGYFVVEELGPDEEDYIAGTVLVCLDSEVR